MELRLDALTYPEVRERLDKGTDLAILLLGAVEQHGPHGPLGTDAYIARGIAKGVAEKEDLLDSLIHNGFKKILILNGHGGNTPAITSAFSEVRGSHPEIFMAQSSARVALADEYSELPEKMRQRRF